MEWQEAALPMSCNIVRKTTTRSTPQSHAAVPQNVVIAWDAVILRFHGHTSRNMWSLKCRQRLGMLTSCFVFLQTLGRVHVTLVYIRYVMFKCGNFSVEVHWV